MCTFTFGYHKLKGTSRQINRPLENMVFVGREKFTHRLKSYMAHMYSWSYRSKPVRKYPSECLQYRLINSMHHHNCLYWTSANVCNGPFFDCRCRIYAYNKKVYCELLCMVCTLVYWLFEACYSLYRFRNFTLNNHGIRHIEYIQLYNTTIMIVRQMRATPNFNQCETYVEEVSEEIMNDHRTISQLTFHQPTPTVDY